MSTLVCVASLIWLNQGTSNFNKSLQRMSTRFFAYILSWKIIRNWQKKFGNYAFLSNQMPQAKFCVLLRKKGKVKAHTSWRLKWSELILVSVAWSMPRSIATPPWTGCYSITGLPPSSMSPVPIYTPGWRESKLIRVSCLRKECNRLEHQASRSRVRGVNH